MANETDALQQVAEQRGGAYYKFWLREGQTVELTFSSVPNHRQLEALQTYTELMRSFAERDYLDELAARMAEDENAQILAMIAERLEAIGCDHGHSRESTPPMMYPEWITCAVASHIGDVTDA